VLHFALHLAVDNLIRAITALVSFMVRQSTRVLVAEQLLEETTGEQCCGHGSGSIDDVSLACFQSNLLQLCDN
jgi:hypothetical protein